MGELVPGRGFAFGARQVIAETQYGVLGPFSEGQILRRVRVFWSVGAATTVRFVASLGSSSQATLGALLAGVSMVQRANAPAAPPLSVGFTLAAAMNGWFELPGGVEIGSGSKYIICEITSTQAAVTTSWIVTAEMWAIKQSGP